MPEASQRLGPRERGKADAERHDSRYLGDDAAVKSGGLLNVARKRDGIEGETLLVQGLPLGLG